MVCMKRQGILDKGNNIKKAQKHERLLYLGLWQYNVWYIIHGEEFVEDKIGISELG